MTTATLIRKPVTKRQKNDARKAEWMEALKKRQAEQAAVNRGIAESVTLRKARGETFDETKRGPTVRDGLDWLYRKERIDQRQRDAGRRYGADYAQTTPSLQSCLNQLDRVDKSAVSTSPDRAQKIRERMQDARENGLKNQTRLINVCNAICGRGETVLEVAKGNDREALRIEATLIIALDMLITHYGM